AAALRPHDGRAGRTRRRHSAGGMRMIIGARVQPGPRAVILAGRQGPPRGPFTAILPKPLLPIGDQAILELLVEQLRLHGFTRLTLAVGYLSHLVEAVMGDGYAAAV